MLRLTGVGIKLRHLTSRRRCGCVFGWLSYSKPRICMLLWWQSPGVMRSLTQTHQPETGWKWVATNLCRGDRGGFGGCHASWIWMWSRKPLSHNSLTSFVTFFPPPLSQLRGIGIKSCHIPCGFWSVHKRALVKEYRMHGWRVKPRRQAVAEAWCYL